MATKFYYVYVLRSNQDGEFYTGYTNDLRARFLQHQSGQVRSTSHRLPVTLIYYEACGTESDATRREKYLKTAWGKRYLKSRLRDYLTG
jgi:putative endonuclease